MTIREYDTLDVSVINGSHISRGFMSPGECGCLSIGGSGTENKIFITVASPDLMNVGDSLSVPAAVYRAVN